MEDTLLFVDDGFFGLVKKHFQKEDGKSKKYLQTELKLPPEANVGTAEILRGTEIIQERELNEQLLMGTFGRIKETVHEHLRILQRSPSIHPSKLKDHKTPFSPYSPSHDPFLH